MQVILGLIVLAVVCFAFLQPRAEPKYQGRYLSEWLATYDAARHRLAVSTVHNPSDPNQQALAQAEHAVRAIGTNALPYLVAWIDSDLPPWRTNLRAKLPRWLARRDVVTRAILGGAFYRSGAAVFGFKILGTNATPAIPELEALMKSTKRRDTPIRAIHALEGIGSQAFPAFTNALADPSHPRRALVVFALGNMASFQSAESTNLYLPVLLQSFADPDRYVRTAATNAVLQIAPELLEVKLSE